jgi:phosphonate transport system substrate-binding protein
MRYLLVLFLGIHLLAGPCPVEAKEVNQITIGFIPGDSPQRVKKSGLELVRRLQKVLGIPMNMYISKNYQGLIDAMKSKKVDFAFFTSMSFVFAEKQAGAKVLLKKVWNSPFYHSVILTRAESPFKTIQDLRGQKFAFVDEKSTSGYLYPGVMFKKEGIEPKSFFKEIIFSGNHKAAVKAVLEGKAAAAAVFANDTEGISSAWEVFNPKAGKKRALWVSDPIPNDPFCVRKDFYEAHPRVVHDIMFAFIDLKSVPGEGNFWKKHFNMSGMIMATSRQYEPVRELVKELKLELK